MNEKNPRSAKRLGVDPLKGFPRPSHGGSFTTQQHHGGQYSACECVREATPAAHAVDRHDVTLSPFNTLTKAQLVELPGIGASSADKIINARPIDTQGVISIIGKHNYERAVEAMLVGEEDQDNG